MRVGKLTGMLLELGVPECGDLLDDESLFHDALREAIEVLEASATLLYASSRTFAVTSDESTGSNAATSSVGNECTSLVAPGPPPTSAASKAATVGPPNRPPRHAAKLDLAAAPACAPVQGTVRLPNGNDNMAHSDTSTGLQVGRALRRRPTPTSPAITQADALRAAERPRVMPPPLLAVAYAGNSKADAVTAATAPEDTRLSRVRRRDSPTPAQRQ